MRFGGDGFVEVLSATQTPTEKVWFQGTADAVRQYKWMLQDVKNRAVEDVSPLRSMLPVVWIAWAVCVRGVKDWAVEGLLFLSQRPWVGALGWGGQGRMPSCILGCVTGCVTNSCFAALP